MPRYKATYPDFYNFNSGRKTMFHKILIGSDGSENSRNAALLASEIARHFGSETVVVNAFDISFAAAGDVGAWSLTASPDLIEECMQGERAAAENVVKPSLEALQPPYRMLQETGHPVNVLLQVAAREKVDLIVVGNRSQSRLNEFILGSVSHGVLHHAHCPVLIERGSVQPLQRILLACDGSLEAQKAAAAAFTLAKEFDACLSVLNVEEPTGWLHRADTDPHPVKTLQECEAKDRRYRTVEESIHAAAQETGMHYRVCYESGHAGEAIVRFAKDGLYDMIVMGSRGLNGFERLLLGSASNYVSSHAHCSVLVVR
jgi:nucleotide-binding universal stress UspA family protein